MSHYEERLQADLDKIRVRVADVGERVETALGHAVKALLTSDRELAGRTILGDQPINREVRAIDQACHAFVARHLPSAGPLRYISSVLRLTIELERIGDYAATICREAVQLSTPIPQTIAGHVELMADQSQRVLAQAIIAWNNGNAELARGTVGMSKQASSAFDKLIKSLLQEGTEGSYPLQDLFAWLTVLARLSRVVGQAKNICEETIFAVTGESKAEKTYRVLFLDETNGCFSQMAAAYCSRAYPGSGVYESAGWAPAEALEARCQVFMERQGFDTVDVQPQSLQDLDEDLASFHVIVGLGGSLQSHLPEIPFHSIALEWDLGPDVEGLDQERAEHLLDAAWNSIRARCGELMETLRGEGAP